MAVEDIGKIQDIELKDVKDASDSLVFSEQEISDPELKNEINTNLEGLWGQFFQGKNKEELKDLAKNSSDDAELLKQAESLFDAWVGSENYAVIEELTLNIKKGKELKEYLKKSPINLNLTDLALKTLKSQIKNPTEKFPEYPVNEYATFNILNADTSKESMKAKFDNAGPIYIEVKRGEETVKELLTFKQFAENIHGVVEAYFSDLDFVDEHTLESMNVGVQFALMNGVKKEDINFFNAFSETSTNNKTGAFKGIISAFLSGQQYLALATRLENLKYHLQQNKQQYGNCSGVVELTNPMAFKNILESTAFDNKDTIVLSTGEPQSLTEDDKVKLQGIANAVPLTDDMILKINASTQKATELLGKRNERKSDISGTYASLSSAVEGVVSSMGGLAEMVGIDTGGSYLIDILGESNGTIRKIVNFILGLIGFSGGLEGVHKDYIKNNINKGIELQPERKAFISQALKFYQTYKTTIKSQNGQTTFDNIPELKALKEEDKQVAKNKIPGNYALLSDSLKTAIEENPSALNVNIVKSLGMAGVKYTKKTVKNSEGKEEKVEVVESIPTDENIINGFIDKYLKKTIPELMKNQKFMKKITSPDDFAFALMGNLVLDHFFVEGVALGIEDTSKYGGIEKVENNSENKEYKSWEERESGLLDFIANAEGTGNNYNAVFGDGQQNNEKFVDMTIEEVLEYQTNILKQQKEDKKDILSSAIGRYQFIKSTLENLVKQNNIDKKEKFTPDMQDKLARIILKNCGIEKFKKKEITLEQFQKNIAGQRASLPENSEGLSVHQGINGNYARVSHQKTLWYLQQGQAFA